MSAREEILGSIRRALNTSSRLSPSVAGPPSSEERAGGGDVLQAFESQLARAGGRFYRAESAGAACAYISSVAAEREAATIMGWKTPLMEEIGLRASLEGLGVRFITEGLEGGGLSNAASSDIGITGVDYALAETGSLVLLSRRGQARSVSLLPPVHIALIKPEQVLSGFDELFASLPDPLRSPEMELSSAVTFITGPSRTADIELTLVVGVHGPQHLHVVLLENLNR